MLLSGAQLRGADVLAGILELAKLACCGDNNADAVSYNYAADGWRLIGAVLTISGVIYSATFADGYAPNAAW